MTDPQLRQEVATKAVGRHLRANPPEDSNVDDMEVTFTAVIMRTAELGDPSLGKKETRARLVEGRSDRS